MRMIEEVREAMRVHEISEYGEDRLPAGPSIHTSDAIIVVEGRSDVLNLLKYGIKNTVAVEGVSVPRSIGELTKKFYFHVAIDFLWKMKTYRKRFAIVVVMGVTKQCTTKMTSLIMD